jgi:hypothetical protein
MLPHGLWRSVRNAQACERHLSLWRLALGGFECRAHPCKRGRRLQAITCQLFRNALQPCNLDVVIVRLQWVIAPTTAPRSGIG